MILWIYNGLIECADFNDGRQRIYQGSFKGPF